MKAKLQVLEQDINTHIKDGVEYISITDIARYKSPDRTDILIGNLLRNRNTLEFLGIWEQLNNPDFKPIEFDGFNRPLKNVGEAGKTRQKRPKKRSLRAVNEHFEAVFNAVLPTQVVFQQPVKKQAGLNSFTLTPKQWIEQIGALGLVSKAGRFSRQRICSSSIRTPEHGR